MERSLEGIEARDEHLQTWSVVRVYASACSRPWRQDLSSRPTYFADDALKFDVIGRLGVIK